MSEVKQSGERKTITSLLSTQGCWIVFADNAMCVPVTNIVECRAHAHLSVLDNRERKMVSNLHRFNLKRISKQIITQQLNPVFPGF